MNGAGAPPGSGADDTDPLAPAQPAEQHAGEPVAAAQSTEAEVAPEALPDALPAAFPPAFPPAFGDAEWAQVQPSTSDSAAENLAAVPVVASLASTAAADELEPLRDFTPESASGPGRDNGLREAVGLGPETRTRGESGGPRSASAGRTRGRRGLVLAAAVLAATLVAAVALLGFYNSRTYALRCEPARIVATQGRFVPPWGQGSLSGPAWKPIPIPASAECEDQELDSRDKLARAFRDQLLGQVETWLTARRPRGLERERIGTVHEQLEQALLLSRSPGSQEARTRVQRLLGDLAYWRGQDELDAARERLRAAAERFREANERTPLHAGDAAAWQGFAAQAEQALAAGLAAARPAPAATATGQNVGPNVDHDLGQGAAPVPVPEATTTLLDASIGAPVGEPQTDAGVGAQPGAPGGVGAQDAGAGQVPAANSDAGHAAPAPQPGKPAVPPPVMPQPPAIPDAGLPRGGKFI